jgi:LuxR family transcriptional regulator, quorum-sensing system regulator BjaR1
MMPQNLDLADFIYRTNEASTPQELKDIFLKFIYGFGLDRFIMGEISHDSTSKKEEYLSILANYPEDWLKHYVEKHYVDHDPVYHTALISKKPFTWHEMDQIQKLTPQAKAILNEAKESKMYNGIGLSIYQPFGQIIGMGLASSQKEFQPYDKNTLHIIYAACNQFFIAYSDLARPNTSINDNIVLTVREREVLLWLARGKRKDEIAFILNLSTSSIKRYCESIFLKLQANSVQLAIAKALRLGLIHPF